MTNTKAEKRGHCIQPGAGHSFYKDGESSVIAKASCEGDKTASTNSKLQQVVWYAGRTIYKETNPASFGEELDADTLAKLAVE